MDAEFRLLREIKRGSEYACEQFVRRYYPQILTYCRYHCPDRIYAEDLAQETFARFFAGLPNYRHRGKAKQYLYTIAGNLCRDYYKKKREVPLEGEQFSRLEAAGENRLEEVQTLLALEQAMDRLPEAWKEVVILFYFQDLKLTEIADLLQIGVPLVKYRLKQARGRLKELLGEEEDT